MRNEHRSAAPTRRTGRRRRARACGGAALAALVALGLGCARNREQAEARGLVPEAEVAVPTDRHELREPAKERQHGVVEDIQKEEARQLGLEVVPREQPEAAP